MKMKSLIAVAAILGLASTISLRAADGKQLYSDNCAKCHGDDGKGQTKMGQKLGARDYTDAKVQDSVKDEDGIKAIKEGLKDKDGKTLMKANADVSDADAKAMMDYMRTFKK